MIITPSELTPYIGIPFARHGVGPDRFNCYSFVQEMFRVFHQIRLPSYKSPEDSPRISALIASELYRWRKVSECPTPGVMAVVRAARCLHVGFVIDHSNMIHCIEPRGVSIERVSNFQKVLGFYEYVGNSAEVEDAPD